MGVICLNLRMTVVYLRGLHLLNLLVSSAEMNKGKNHGPIKISSRKFCEAEVFFVFDNLRT